ncbi:MAG: hypothetical protein DRP29_07660 [Thermodesulfobacteriota bacterium]|nr:MAG: hypothetical protein DRP29_07660 [Thermodesulfobacteriota bacterium]
MVCKFLPKILYISCAKITEMIVKIKPEDIPYDKLITQLCITPYHGHSKGCPNYGKKDGCPPRLMVHEVFDFEKDIYVIFTKFQVGAFAEKMRQTHPYWSASLYPDIPIKSLEYVAEIESKIRAAHREWPEEYFPKRCEQKWESSREWYNPRRWQPAARKLHKAELDCFFFWA